MARRKKRRKKSDRLPNKRVRRIKRTNSFVKSNTLCGKTHAAAEMCCFLSPHFFSGQNRPSISLLFPPSQIWFFRSTPPPLLLLRTPKNGRERGENCPSLSQEKALLFGSVLAAAAAADLLLSVRRLSFRRS